MSQISLQWNELQSDWLGRNGRDVISQRSVLLWAVHLRHPYFLTVRTTASTNSMSTAWRNLIWSVQAQYPRTGPSFIAQNLLSQICHIHFWLSFLLSGVTWHRGYLQKWRTGTFRFLHYFGMSPDIDYSFFPFWSRHWEKVNVSKNNLSKHFFLSNKYTKKKSLKNIYYSWKHIQVIYFWPWISKNICKHYNQFTNTHRSVRK